MDVHEPTVGVTGLSSRRYTRQLVRPIRRLIKRGPSRVEWWPFFMSYT